MQTNFQIVHDFLRAFQPEVQGRSADGADSTLDQQITAFAAGELGEDQLGAFSREVLGSDGAMERLAALLGAPVGE